MASPVQPRCLIRGSINVDEYFNVKHIAQPGETLSSHGLAKRPGGKGANQAVAVAKAGGQADFFGAVGEDGAWTLDHLEEHGVDVSLSEHVQELTGRALIQVADDGENSIILFKGANYAKLPKKPIQSATTHLLLQNEIPLEESLVYLAEAASRSIVTIFNPSPMPTDEELKVFPFERVTWLIVNDIEARDLYRILTTRQGTDTESEQDAAHTNIERYTNIPAYPIAHRLLSQMPTTNIVCTLGGNGVLVILPTIRDDAGLPEPIYLKAAKLEKGVVDTTGAGDTFAGYMAAGLMKLQHEKGTRDLGKEDVVAVMTRCVQAGGLCVQTPGAMASIPFGSDVDARLGFN
ncbi:putative ribokinase [Marasmius crinis-equi]|uniref:Ribokinase n=1 Tax=Marasmius crinis-equi TaxID=585013 RepID=A0ABR3F5E4_9AGAR